MKSSEYGTGGNGALDLRTPGSLAAPGHSDGRNAGGRATSAAGAPPGRGLELFLPGVRCAAAGPRLPNRAGPDRRRATTRRAESGNAAAQDAHS